MTVNPFPWEETVFLWINRHSGSRLDYIFAWPTYLGNAVILLAIVLIYMLIWDDGKIIRKFLVITASAAASGIFTQLLKHWIRRPRPYGYFQQQIVDGKLEVNNLFGLLLSNSSMPSGHTTSVFAIVTALNYIYGKKMRPLYFFALYVALTRIYVGAHFPLDILGGAIIGIVLGQLFTKILYPINWTKLHPWEKLWK